MNTNSTERHSRSGGSARGTYKGRPSYNRTRRYNSGGGDRRRSGRRGAPKGGQTIDVNRFINKAVEIKEDTPFTPKNHFGDFAVHADLKKNIERKGYTTPTPIQDESIPHVLEGKDIVGIANTGTGKTGAFLIPLINKILKGRKQRVLVMVPTRELANQIEEEFQGFAYGLRIGAVTCVGGANIHRQMSGLKRNPNIVVGTPGRIKDLMERRALQLSNFRTVVLDEADRMLDMGFIHDMKHILSHMPAERHTLFFSATLSREIRALVGDFLNDPVHVSVKIGETASGVEQDIVRIGGKDKVDVLYELLTQETFKKVLVFGRTKHGVEKLSKLLFKHGIKADAIHGNKTQNKRERSLDLFKKGRIQVLVATDVAARGIDVNDVTHVINYDIPGTYDDYVHRIGRTARAGKKGHALTFV